MGNTGVPSGTNHGVPKEVDETMSNPSVPAREHGIENQLVPGGSPSAAKRRESRWWGAAGPVATAKRHGSFMNPPYFKGLYEMGHERP